MIFKQKALLSELMQQATLSAARGDASTGCMKLEQILANESESLSSRQRSRAQRVLELIRRMEAPKVAPAHERLPEALKDETGEHHLLQEIPWPKISIVTPTYNQGHFIADTILSILNQNYPNLEYIIMDGGSKDQTLEVIEKYKGRISHVVSEPDKGQSNAINKGMKLTTGEILYWLNSDDMLEPNTLFYVGLNYLETGFDLLAGTCTPFDNDRSQLNNRHMATMPFSLRLEDITDIESTWLKGMYFHQPEVFFSRRLWEAAGGYVDESLYYSMDYDLWARMAQVSHFPVQVSTAGKSFCLYREHSNQKTSTVEAYLPELLSHSKVLRERHLSISGKGIFSRAKEYRQKLSIVSISDFGFNGGAGVAHKRVCQVLQAAGHDIVQLSGFQEWQSETLDQPVESILEALEILQPDLVLLGNLHNLKHGLNIAEHCANHFPTVAIAHDFWWLTGRCAYTHGCHYLFTRCSSVCPTPQEYPRLDPLKISLQHQRKKQLLQHRNLFILANSAHTQRVYQQAVNAWGGKANSVGLVRLPIVPEGQHELFFPETDTSRINRFTKTAQVRIVLGCTDHADFRKGSDLAALALQRLLAEHEHIQIDVYGRSSDLILDSLAEFSNRILLHGYLSSKEEYQALLEGAHIFLGTSREETLGQTFVEAAHAGLITVGPMESGYADVVRACRFSLGYEGVEVENICIVLEQALACLRQLEPAQIRSIQHAQAQAAFSGMSFLSSFNHHLYVSGLWKRLRYHGPTKIFDIDYKSLQIEEMVLASTHADHGENVQQDELISNARMLTVDKIKLGPGLYPEEVDNGIVAWLMQESTLIVPNPGVGRVTKLKFHLHWIPEPMLHETVSLKICGHQPIVGGAFDADHNTLDFILDHNDLHGVRLPSRLLISIKFSGSIQLPDGRDGLSVILKAIETHGYSSDTLHS